MVHFRVGELDGVSLEMDKWKTVLQKAGHEVFYAAETVGSTDGYQIPEIGLNYQPSLKIRKNAFDKFSDYESELDFKEEIQKCVDKTMIKLQKFIDTYEINYIIPNNMFSLPLNLPATIALYRVIKNNNLHGVSHNHDFYWERDWCKPTRRFIQQYLDQLFPPIDLPNLKHAVINSLAQTQLEHRKNLKSTVIPNVFYFSEPAWEIDDFNKDLREKIEVGENDILILQATRIVQRKGIELAIDLLNELNKPEYLDELRAKPLYNGKLFEHDNKIVFIFPNLIEDPNYKEKIENKLKKHKIMYRFCNDYFASERIPGPEKKFSLWDSYAHSDLVTYPSLQEGWGNQFLEAVKAKLPIILFEYDVYRADIGIKGFDTISLGFDIIDKDEEGLVCVSQEKIQEAAKKVIRALTDPEYRNKLVENNFQIGVEKFSLEALSEYILPLVQI